VGKLESFWMLMQVVNIITIMPEIFSRVNTQWERGTKTDGVPE
jgi:hypothetical protein